MDTMDAVTAFANGLQKWKSREFFKYRRSYIGQFI